MQAMPWRMSVWGVENQHHRTLMERVFIGRAWVVKRLSGGQKARQFEGQSQEGKSQWSENWSCHHCVDFSGVDSALLSMVADIWAFYVEARNENSCSRQWKEWTTLRTTCHTWGNGFQILPCCRRLQKRHVGNDHGTKIHIVNKWSMFEGAWMLRARCKKTWRVWLDGTQCCHVMVK